MNWITLDAWGQRENETPPELEEKNEMDTCLSCCAEEEQGSMYEIDNRGEQELYCDECYANLKPT
jgi:hypothetical protein